MFLTVFVAIISSEHFVSGCLRGHYLKRTLCFWLSSWPLSQANTLFLAVFTAIISSEYFVAVFVAIILSKYFVSGCLRGHYLKRILCFWLTSRPLSQANTLFLTVFVAIISNEYFVSGCLSCHYIDIATETCGTGEAHCSVLLNSPGVCEEGTLEASHCPELLALAGRSLKSGQIIRAGRKEGEWPNVFPANTDSHSIPLPAISPSGVFFCPFFLA